MNTKYEIVNGVIGNADVSVTFDRQLTLITRRDPGGSMS
jgi:hypothetical protein